MCSFSQIAPCVMRWPSTKCWISFTASQVLGLIKPNVPYHSRPPVIKSNEKSFVLFREVQLPLKYWGLPLVSTRLRHSDCLPLFSWTRKIEKLTIGKEGCCHEWSSSPQCLQAFTSIGRPLSGFRRRSWNPFHWAFGISFGQAPNPPIRSIRSAGPM